MVACQLDPFQSMQISPYPPLPHWLAFSGMSFVAGTTLAECDVELADATDAETGSASASAISIPITNKRRFNVGPFLEGG